MPVAAVAALVDPGLELIVTPTPEGGDGHAAFAHAIDGAQHSIELTMFHLTDEAIVAALTRAAARGVAVRVILDGKGLHAATHRRAADALRAGGVEVRPSSPAFSITHTKAMVVDRDAVFVTAINLTRDADRTRDFGVITHDRAIAGDVEALFDADWRDAETGRRDTPVLHAPSLVVSPVGSRDRLIALIGSARHELVVTVENLGDPAIEDALAAAARRGAAVRAIVPSCDKNPNPLYNLPAARRLAATGVAIRLMPAPETPETPYMHAKMILADGAIAYVGSVNFTVNSTTRARELGVIFANPAAAAQIRAIFESDWRRAAPPPAAPPAHCTDVHSPTGE